MVPNTYHVGYDSEQNRYHYQAHFVYLIGRAINYELISYRYVIRIKANREVCTVAKWEEVTIGI